MGKFHLEECFASAPLILTEGAVGQRLEHEFGLKPDPDIMYAGFIYDPAGRDALSAIYRSYLQVAADFHLPILLMTNTRRANKERLLRSGFCQKNVMRDYSLFLRELIGAYKCTAYIGGMMGCKGDAYSGEEGLPTEEAISFHAWQAEMFDSACLDFLFAGIMPTLPEAMGMAKVMETAAKPYIISLMIQRDGTLLDGHTIHRAIEAIDGSTGRKPLCYMTNCVHPAILKESLLAPANQTDLVRERFCGVQANAACLEPQKLENSAAMITSSPQELAAAFGNLHRSFPLKIYGGCCGTDDRHIREMVKALS